MYVCARQDEERNANIKMLAPRKQEKSRLNTYGVKKTFYIEDEEQKEKNVPR